MTHLSYVPSHNLQLSVSFGSIVEKMPNNKERCCTACSKWMPYDNILHSHSPTQFLSLCILSIYVSSYVAEMHVGSADSRHHYL